jgi:hypothetical protein
MALACMSGWPDEPDSPLHSFGGVGVGAGVAAWAVSTFGLAALATGIGCAKPGAAAPSSSAPPNTNWEAKEAERFGINLILFKHIGAAVPVMSSALWPYPMFGPYWAKIWLSEG